MKNTTLEFKSVILCEISADDFVSLYDKKSNCIYETRIIPPVLGSPGFGKVLIDISAAKKINDLFPVK